MEAADDIAAFMAIFFEHFTKFKGRALHLAGESYGVRVGFPLDEPRSYLNAILGPIHPSIRFNHLRQECAAGRSRRDTHQPHVDHDRWISYYTVIMG